MAKPAFKGETKAQQRYWAKRLPGASGHQVRAARNKQIYQHNPQAFGPGTNLTPLQLQGNVNAQANLRYGPQLSQLGTQLKQVDPVYDQYRAALSQAQGASQTAADTAYKAITGQSAGLEQATGAQDQHLLDQMRADAAARGAQVDPQIAAQMAQAAASRQSAANTQAGLSQQLGQNSSTYLAALQGVGNTQRESRRQGIQQNLSDVLQQRGAFKTTESLAEKEQAVRDAIEYGTLSNSALNAQTAAGAAASLIGNRRSTAREKKRHDVQTEKNTANDPSRQKTQAELDFFKQHHYWPPTGPPKNTGTGPASFTPTQLRSNRQSYRGALGWAHSHDPKPGEEQQLIHALLAPKGGSKPKTVTVHDPTTGKIIYNPDGTPKTTTQGGSSGGFGIKDPLLARAVAFMAIYGGVSAKIQRGFLRNYGIRLPLQKTVKTPPFKGTGRNPGERPT